MDGFKVPVNVNEPQAVEAETEDFGSKVPATPEQFVPPVEALPVIKKGGKVKKILLAFLGILLIGAGVGVAYWQYTEAQQAKKSLSDTETLLATAKSKVTDLEATALANKVTVLSESKVKADTVAVATLVAAEKTSIETATSTFYCSQTDFSCENVTQTTLRYQKEDTTKNTAGFAVVQAKSSTTTEYVWLKKKATAWVVVYWGQSNPSADVMKTFGLPTAMNL